MLSLALEKTREKKDNISKKYFHYFQKHTILNNHFIFSLSQSFISRVSHLIIRLTWTYILKNKTIFRRVLCCFWTVIYIMKNMVQQRIMWLKDSEVLLEMRAFGLVLNRILCLMIPTTCNSTSLQLSPSICLTFLSTNNGFFKEIFDPVSSWYPIVKV